jgi:hypothetical protein
MIYLNEETVEEILEANKDNQELCKSIKKLVTICGDNEFKITAITEALFDYLFNCTFTSIEFDRGGKKFNTSIRYICSINNQLHAIIKVKK